MPGLPPRPASRLAGVTDRRAWWLIGAAAGGAVLLIVMWVVLVRRHAPAAVKPPASAAAPADERKIHATLFYVSEDGSDLSPVSREVPYGPTSAEQARRIIEAEMQDAPDKMSSAIPAGTTVRAVYLTTRGDAYVDFSRQIVEAHTGGSLDEALTVFAIVDGLTVNLPEITGVEILVDGKEVDTLAGHIDLRHPLGRSLKWVRKGQQ